MKKTKIISIVNQKGGVGKTTTAINLATVLAAIDKQVLLVDFDPQGNASTGLGIAQNERIGTIYDVLIDRKCIDEVIFKTKIPNLHLIPSTIDLSAGEIDLVNIKKREHKLKEKLGTLSYDYDYIFIDCPPSLGLLTVNALVASHMITVPLQCEFFALEGLSHLFEVIERIKLNFNKTLKIDGIVLTMHDKRNKLTEQVEADARDCLGDLIYKNIIPRNIKLSEAPSHGMPAILYDSYCSGSLAYMEFAEEMIEKHEKL
ncbi:ParA family protein [Pseudomonadota bacterium]